ncbi:MAG: nucleotide exchange factor GrpE [Planctomycetes bacterium]|nr:nucleotide exchange factor GrpE [Planctomycetota bacterium]
MAANDKLSKADASPATDTTPGAAPAGDPVAGVSGAGAGGESAGAAAQVDAVAVRAAALRALDDAALLALADAGARAEEAERKLLYALAEQQNIRKRAQRDEEMARFLGAKGVIAEVLPVIDNLRRALAGDLPEAAEEFRRGIRIVLEQLLQALKNRGLTPIPTAGKTFDARWHEAVVVEPSENGPDGAILEELEAGYRLGDVLIRPAKVKVAKSKA